MLQYRSFRYYLYQRSASTTISKSLEEYLDVKHVIPCANGTDALQIAMMGLDLKPGDEVINICSNC
jgi:dTDP-4-amino-4,6-dideoxygalactose transaminase